MANRSLIYNLKILKNTSKTIHFMCCHGWDLGAFIASYLLKSKCLLRHIQVADSREISLLVNESCDQISIVPKWQNMSFIFNN
ncbi:hypothetical protein BLOT_015196 [Blomia tropicalis]|nr:hypothetical protein BLOT_015196 [Blomia tropicalis]